jgi:pimeloyl-ACP methyl ester carboxylesterase
MLKPSTYTILIENTLVMYQRVGSGFPVVMIHGLSGSTRWWIHNIQSLSQHYCVYLIDLPGFGSMRSRYTHLSLEQTGPWIVQVMEALHLQQAHLIGHSMGGLLCLWIAAHHPEVVARLVLVSPAVFLPQKQSAFSYMLPLLRGVRDLRPPFLPILAVDALRAGPRVLLRTVNDLLKLDMHKEIKDITVPTLLVWGERDTLVPLSIGYILRQELSQSRLFVIKRVGHTSMFDRPREFNAAVIAFLQGDIVGE